MANIGFAVDNLSTDSDSDNNEHLPSQQERPLQLIRLDRRNDFEESLELNLDSKVLSSVLDTCKGRKVCVVTVAGHARSGKSYLLNCFKDGCRSAEKEEDNNWLSGEKDISGFHHSHRYNSATTGIWIWSRAFLVSGEDGEEIAVLLLDAQGFHDEFTKQDEITAILGISLLTSSIIVLNLSGDLTDEPFQWLERFEDYGNLCIEKGIRDPFQKLSFLVRDWTRSSEYSYGANSGNKLFNKMVNLNGRPTITKFFEEVDCCLLPHIGCKAVTQSFNGNPRDLDKEFSRRLQTYMKNTFDSEKICVKKILGNQLTPPQFKWFITAYVNLYGNKVEMEWGPRAESVWSVTVETTGKIMITQAMLLYNQICQQRMQNSAGGYLKQPTFEVLHLAAKRKAVEAFHELSMPKDDAVNYQRQLDKLLEAEKIKLQNINGSTRRTFTTANIDKASTKLREELELHFPFTCKDVPTHLVFYEDAHFNGTVRNIVEKIKMEFVNNLPNEEEEAIASLQGALLQVAQVILDKYTHQNTGNRQSAIAAAKKVTEKLKCDYVAVMNDFLEECSDTTPNTLKYFHKKEVKTMMEKFGKQKIGTSSFQEEWFDRLKDEMDEHFEVTEANLDWTQANIAKMVDAEVRDYREDLAEKATLMEANEIQNYHHDTSQAILRKFKSTNQLPRECKWVPEMCGKLETKLEKAYRDVVQMGILKKRENEKKLGCAKQSAVEMYQNTMKNQLDNLFEFTMDDGEFDEMSYSSQKLALASFDSASEMLELDPEKLEEEKDRLNEKLDADEDALKIDNTQKRNLAVSLADEIYTQCSQELETKMSVAVTKLNTREELLGEYKKLLKLALQEFHDTCTTKKQVFRECYFNKIQEKAKQVFSDMDEFFGLKLQTENLGMMTVWLDVKKAYVDNMEAHFNNQDGDGFPKEKLFELHEGAEKLSLGSVDEVATLTKGQLEEVKCRLTKLFQKYSDKNEFILQSFEDSDPAIGIDLGTTYCCVAIYHKGKVHILRNSLGENTTPSYIRIEADDTIICGHPAKELAFQNPESTIYDAKRIIGRRIDDINLQKDMEYWPFNVIEGEHGVPKIELNGKTYFPEEISAKLLKHLKMEAEQILGFPIKKAVITVPAYFTDGQRKATLDAGQLAGLELLGILNEPTAAAFAYRMDRFHEEDAKNILVYDLGGGTFDVAVLKMSMDEIEVLSVDGDDHLGGEDFDQNMMEYCANEFLITTGVDLFGRKDSSNKTESDDARRTMRRLQTQCEKAKMQLGKAARKATISIAALMDGEDLVVEMLKSEFEKRNVGLFEKTIKIVDAALASAKLQKADIHEVVLVGGSTRIPKIQEMLEKHFDGKHISKKINPDEAVAYGAAVQAAIVNAKEGAKLFDFGRIYEVIPMSLGIEMASKKFDAIIKKNTKIPTEATQKYATYKDLQTSCWIKIFQGEKELAAENRLLGNFHLEGIPPGKAGEEKVDVTMKIDANGILSVNAVCKSTGGSANITISEERGRMSEDDKRRLLGEKLIP